MTDLKGAAIVVIGGGAIGSAVALALARGGAAVTVADPEPANGGASGVAAGMLAPAFEALLDPVSGDHFTLLRAARALWPMFLDGLELTVDRCGALWIPAGGDDDGKALWDRLNALGAAGERLAAGAALRLSPGLAWDGPALHTPEDWRIEPLAALRGLETALRALNGRRTAARVRAVQDSEVILEDGRRLGADLVVFAGGWAPGAEALAPELARLTPIKGQIAHMPATGPLNGPIIRAPGLYVTPSSAGAMAGATMEAGIGDRRVDPAAVDGLAKGATALFPHMAGAQVIGRAGVRAASPDGLPLVGRSARQGLLLAAGARRNGWLLAPLIAQMTAAIAAGKGAGPWAALFAPDRFEGGGV